MTAAIRHKREIVDRTALDQALATIAAAREQSDAWRRAAVLALLKQTLAAGAAEIERRFAQSGSGAACVRGRAFLIDELIAALYAYANRYVYRTPNPTTAERMAVVAVGGYGRGDLAPFSDVDLLFVLPYKPTPRHEQIVEYLLYMLWDMGLKVGHATRSIADCLRQARADHTIRTTLLETRVLCGDVAVFDELRQRYNAEVRGTGGLRFVEAKLEERRSRHARAGESRFLLEPDIKDGKGGLRDLHSLGWIAKELFAVDSVGELVARGILTAAEAETFRKAQNYLWTLRCHLHYLTGRAEERLTFDVQPRIAQRMGYTDHAGTQRVERFMKHYFLVAKDVGDLTRIFCAAFEAQHKKRPLLRLPSMLAMRAAVGELGDFRLQHERLTVRDDGVFAADPVNVLRLVHVALARGVDIHPHALRLVRQNLKRVDAKLRADPEANRLFLEILTSRVDPLWGLQKLNEAGVLGRFIPDFGRVVAQMQFDMYHVYTVDEHTIRAVGNLHKVETGALRDAHPISTEIMQQVLSRRVLYLAVFLHDIAKGRGGNHSRLGEKVARRLCPRLGLSEAETDMVAWLVREHLVMSFAAFKRDVDDPKTVEDFAAAVRSPERLRLLLVLTVVDIRSTGPTLWNAWKRTLLTELYWRTNDLLTGHQKRQGTDARVANAKAALREALAGWSDADFEAVARLGTVPYWLAFDSDTLARHAAQVRQAERDHAPLSLDTRVDAVRAVTEVTVYAADHPGLFSRIAGALALSGVNIVDARIFTLTNGMALDVFSVQDEQGAAVARGDRLAKLAARIQQTLAGQISPAKELRKQPAIPSRTRVFKVPPQVLIDNKASNTHTVVEVNGRDRRGLLFDLTRALTRCGLQISSAVISTYGEAVVDVFYVKDVFGMKVTQERKLEQIEAAMLAAIADPTCQPKAAPEAKSASEPPPAAKAKPEKGKAEKGKGKAAKRKPAEAKPGKPARRVA